jgi:hypothetical protein
MLRNQTAMFGGATNLKDTHRLVMDEISQDEDSIMSSLIVTGSSNNLRTGHHHHE